MSADLWTPMGEDVTSTGERVVVAAVIAFSILAWWVKWRLFR